MYPKRVICLLRTTDEFKGGTLLKSKERGKFCVSYRPLLSSFPQIIRESNTAGHLETILLLAWIAATRSQ